MIAFTDDGGFTQTLNIPLIGVANQQTERIRVSSNQGLNPSTNFSVQLSLQTSGSGSVTFADGTTVMDIAPTKEQPAIVQLKGMAASSKADDMTIIAKVGNKVVASQKFSVVSVGLSINATGHVSVDDSVRSAYISFSGVGSDSLGPVIIPFAQGDSSGCRTAVEIVGTVSPSNYKGKVILRRTFLEGSAFDQNTFLALLPQVDDTSFPEDRDDNPALSKAHVYDIDLPGLKTAQRFIGTTRRFRQNFSEYAVLDSEQNSVPASLLSWYSRTSCTVTNAGPQFNNDFAGDNQAAQGCTKLSLDLQSSDHAGSVCAQ